MGFLVNKMGKEIRLPLVINTFSFFNKIATNCTLKYGKYPINRTENISYNRIQVLSSKLVTIWCIRVNHWVL